MSAIACSIVPKPCQLTCDWTRWHVGRQQPLHVLADARRPRRARGRRPRDRRAWCAAACTRSATAGPCPGAGRSFTVRLTPSTVIEPCSTISSASDSRAARRRRARVALLSTRVDTTPTPSTWPCTMWPPSRSPSAHRALEIHPAPNAPVADRRALERRVNGGDREPAVAVLAHGETRAVERDALAVGEIAVATAHAAARARPACRRSARSFRRRRSSPVNMRARSV